jgi:hypothetical protein
VQVPVQVPVPVQVRVQVQAPVQVPEQGWCRRHRCRQLDRYHHRRHTRRAPMPRRQPQLFSSCGLSLICSSVRHHQQHPLREDVEVARRGRA